MNIQEIIFSPYAIFGIIALVSFLIIRNEIRKFKAMNKISVVQTFPGIDELRNTKYFLNHFFEELMEREEQLIEREISNLIIKDDISFVTAEEVVTSFNRTLRQGFEEVRKKFRNTIHAFIEKNLTSMRKENKFDKEKLKGLERLAQCIHHTILMEQIGTIKKIHHPVQEEEAVTA